MHPCDFQTLSRKLRRRARRLGMGPEDGEDIVQETLLRLMQSDAQAPERYAMVILRNLARARWRAQIDTEPFEDDTAAVASAAEVHLTCEELRRAIGNLPEDQARILSLVL